MLGDQHKNTKMKDDVVCSSFEVVEETEVQLHPVDKRQLKAFMTAFDTYLYALQGRPLSKLEENLVIKICFCPSIEDYFRCSCRSFFPSCVIWDKSQIYFFRDVSPFFSKSIPLHLCCKQIELNTCDCVLRKANLSSNTSKSIFSCDFQERLRELFCNLIPPSVVRFEKWEVANVQIHTFVIHYCWDKYTLQKYNASSAGLMFCFAPLMLLTKLLESNQFTLMHI